jgi:hypothetical protein
MSKSAWSLLFLSIAAGLSTAYSQQPATSSLALPQEKHLRNVRQLTFGGQNAEAYFSADDKYLIFQHQGEGVPCDQIYTIPVDTPDGNPATPKLVSTGKGRTLAATSSLLVIAFCFRPRMRPARSVRPSPIIRAATSGRSMTPTTFTPPSLTAATFAA